jgi:hypothetical protein
VLACCFFVYHPFALLAQLGCACLPLALLLFALACPRKTFFVLLVLTLALACHQEVGVLGVFSDWPATTTYYANCMM